MKTTRVSWGSVLVALLFSGTVGFLFGATQMATWQTAVESAQVLAGDVRYSSYNSFYQYHVGAWTLLHQTLSLPLRFDLVNERTLSILLSGAIGAISFLSLSCCALAISRRVFSAVFAPLFTFGLFLGTEQFGVIYPIQMMGTHHTYGVIGRGGALLLLGIYAMGLRKTAMFSAPILLAMHPTWGAWTLLVLGIGALIERKVTAKAPLLPLLIPLILGSCVTLYSLNIQRTFWAQLPPYDGVEAAALFDAFISLWDFHRRPVSLIAPGMLLTVAALLLLMQRRRLFAGFSWSRTMTTLLLVSTCCALVGAVASWVPDALPDIVNRVMPGRFINLTIFALPAILVGAAGTPRDLRLRGLASTVLLGYVVMHALHRVYLSSDQYGWMLPHALGLGFLAVLVFLIGATRINRDIDDRYTRYPRGALVGVIVLLLAFIAVEHKPRSLPIGDNEVIWEVARKHNGNLITTGNDHVVQLRARRPIIVNVGGLDQIVQVPRSGPAMARDVFAIYDIELRNPPEDIRTARPGGFLPGTAHDVITSRPRDQWAIIGEMYGATQILTPSDWKLDLDIVVQDEDYILYALPAI